MVDGQVAATARERVLAVVGHGDRRDRAGVRDQAHALVRVTSGICIIIIMYAESGQTLQGSFSAVSKPNFASKYSLESSRRDLHNALL